MGPSGPTVSENSSLETGMPASVVVGSATGARAVVVRVVRLAMDFLVCCDSSRELMKRHHVGTPRGMYGATSKSLSVSCAALLSFASNTRGALGGGFA